LGIGIGGQVLQPGGLQIIVEKPEQTKFRASSDIEINTTDKVNFIGDLPIKIEIGKIRQLQPDDREKVQLIITTHIQKATCESMGRNEDCFTNTILNQGQPPEIKTILWNGVLAGVPENEGDVLIHMKITTALQLELDGILEHVAESVKSISAALQLQL